MHQEAQAWIAGMTKGRRFARVLEFGSLNINGGVKDVIHAVRYHGIDIQGGPGVDELADAATYQSVSRVDLIVCCEVLEHSPNIEGIVTNAYYNLRQGGVFLVTCAMHPRAPHSAVDGGPIRDGEHYGNVRPEYLADVCEKVGFVVQDTVVHLGRGDLYLRAKKP